LKGEPVEEDDPKEVEMERASKVLDTNILDVAE